MTESARARIFQNSIPYSLPPMSTIYLIRHGETLWNLEGRFQGQLDSDLSPLGYQQVEALREHFANVHIDAVYSSDLGRALKTAAVIGEVHGLKVLEAVELRERSFGIFEGMLRSEAEARAQDAYEAWSSGTFGEVVPGAESRKTMCQRVINCLNTIAERHPQQSVVVLTHGGVLSALWRVLEPDRTEKDGFSIPNASISRAICEKEKWQILEWSNVDHLKGLSSMDDHDNNPHR